MAIKWFAGAETGDLSEGTQLNGSAIVTDNAQVYTGAYSYRIPQNTTANALQSRTGFASQTFYSRYHLRVSVTNNPSSTTRMLIQVDHAGAGGDILQVHVSVTSGGALSLVLRNNVTSSDIGSPFGISGNTWYTIETKTVISATVGVLELKVDGAVVATGSSLNTGTTNIDSIIFLFFNATLDGLVGNFYFDDAICADDGYIGDGRCIARQGKAGSPTDDAFTKVGGATIDAVWSNTPFTTGTAATSSTSSAAQTMLVASFSEVQTGKGTQTILDYHRINACKMGVIMKVGSASNHSLRRRVSGVATDTSKSVTTTDAYYEDTTYWTTAVANLNTAEIGVLHGADTNLLTVEDAWLQADFSVGNVQPPLMVHQSNVIICPDTVVGY